MMLDIKMNKKGDVQRYILLLIILLILVVFIIWLYYSGLIKLILSIKSPLSR